MSFDINLENIEALLKLMTLHKVDKIKLGELELTKNKHDAPKVVGGTVPSVLSGPVAEEDILFWSTSAPPMDQVQKLAFAEETPKLNKKV